MKYIILILCILLYSCRGKINSAKAAQENITYFQDPKTNLCFAQITSYSYGGHTLISIACVPCDSLVKLNLFK